MVLNMRKIIRCFIFIFYYFLVFYCFYHSLKSGENSKHSSDEFSNVLSSVIYLFNVKIDSKIISSLVRKLFGHFCLFFAIGFFAFLRYSLLLKKFNITLYFSLFICLLISIFSEFLQLFANHRNALFTDVLINFLGVFTSIIFIIILLYFSSKNYLKNSFILINFITIFLAILYFLIDDKSISFNLCYAIFFIMYLAYLMVYFISNKKLKNKV